MSLNAFHKFFISISLLLCAFLAVWGIQNQFWGLMTFGIVVGVLLIAYLIWYLRKSKTMMALLPALFLPKISHACAVCFGVVDYNERAATNLAIWFMLGVTLLMLVSVTYFVLKTIQTVQGK